MRSERELEIMEMMRARDSMIDDEQMERCIKLSRPVKHSVLIYLGKIADQKHLVNLKHLEQVDRQEGWKTDINLERSNRMDMTVWQEAQKPKWVEICFEIHINILKQVKSDNWMTNSSQEKQEMARMQRAREIEMMMCAR